MASSTRLRDTTLAASALIAAGLAGTILDNDGRIGLILFLAGAAAGLFLAARRIVGFVARNATVPAQRQRRALPTYIDARAIGVAVVVLGVLLSATNVFKATDADPVSRALNHVAWYGFVLIAASLAAVAIATGWRWLRPRPHRAADA